MSSEASAPLGGQALSAPAVAATTTLLISYGSAIGVIYLKAFWGRFGINPFQFSAASDLLLVGLTGVGATLVAVAVASLFGSILGEKVASWSARFPWLPAASLIAIVVGMILLAVFVDYGIWLTLGVFGTWILLWALHRSSEIPTRFKNRTSLPFVAMALVYMPIAAHYFGAREATRTMSGLGAPTVNVVRSSLPGNLMEPVRLVGRIGSDYFLYEVGSNSVIVVPAREDRRLVLQPSVPARSRRH